MDAVLSSLHDKHCASWMELSVEHKDMMAPQTFLRLLLNVKG